MAVTMDITYWVENPDGSLLWLQPEWLKSGLCSFQRCYRFDMPRFGTIWRKGTRICTNSALAGIRLVLCEELASSLAAFCERGKLRIGACSKCQGERVGEASNPGPPRAATGASRDVADLLSAQLCEPSALGVRWLRGEFGRALSLSLSFARCTGFETVWLGVL